MLPFTWGIVPFALRMANRSRPMRGTLEALRVSSSCCCALFFLACPPGTAKSAIALVLQVLM